MKLNSIYRYRSIKRLLGNNELKNHYFYLSPSTKENDINEGRPMFYLKGSNLFWKGIFRYYYLFTYRHYFSGAKTLDCINNDTKFVNNKVVNLFVSKILPGYRVYLYQMKFIFTIIDWICCRYIFMDMLKHEMNKDKLTLSRFIFIFHQLINIEKYEEWVYYHYNTKIQRKIFKGHKDRGFDLFLKYFGDANFNKIVGRYFQENNNDYLTFMEYHKQFLHKLTALVLPKMYIVSFSNRYDNDEMWANYADKYNGVCLEFYSFDKLSWWDRKALYLNKDLIKFLYKVRYTNKIPKYNLFKYLNLENGLSLNPYLNHLNDNLLEFIFKEIFSYHDVNKYLFQHHSWEFYKYRRKYMCMRSVSFKNKDWKNENEYRLIYFNDGYHNYDIHPKQTYDFKMLKSLTLGSNVSLKDENKVIQILTHECKKINCYNFPIYKIMRKRSGKLGRSLFWIVNPIDNKFYSKLVND